MILAAIFDYLERRIPNWLTFSGVLAGISLNTFLFAAPGLWTSLKGLALALLIYIPLFALRGVGAGDVKLMASLGAIGGPAAWIGIMLFTAIFGGLAALVLVWLKYRFRQTFQNIGSILTKLLHGRAPFEGNPQLDVRSPQALRLPHAVVIACGTIAFLAVRG